MEGRGMWVWRIDKCGGVQAIVDYAVALNLGHVLIKVLDGDRGFQQHISSLVIELGRVGIEAVLWGYHRPQNDPRHVIDIMNENQDTMTYIVNAEKEWVNGECFVADFMKPLRDKGFDVGLSTYAIRHLHVTFPYDAFFKHCEYFLPQCYGKGTQELTWDDGSSSGLVIIPTYRAYRGDGTNDLETIRDWIASIPEPDKPHSFWHMESAMKLGLFPTPEQIGGMQMLINDLYSRELNRKKLKVDGIMGVKTESEIEWLAEDIAHARDTMNYRRV